MTLDDYLRQTAATRPERMRWWHEARFGMFIHWGLYSQLGRHEWVMNRERIPIPEYEKLAATWQPGPAPAREWARLAKQAGMQYMVLTTKHHEGFCLWDTQQTDYNAVKHGPGRDLVAEYVAACREFGLKVGFYYSLMDWHHLDGARCATDEAARRRFLDFTQGCVRELCTQYGRLDILWYDVSWPLESPERWESPKMNQMVRELQPHIIINNRSQLAEDYGTPEEQVTPAKAGRAWEACMTLNDSWGYQRNDDAWKTGIGPVTRMLSGWGLKFFDYDNDGLMDLVLSNGHPDDLIEARGRSVTYREPMILFHNEGNGKMRNVSEQSGEVFKKRISARGLAVGDLNNDGYPDILVGVNGGPPAIELRQVTDLFDIQVVGVGEKEDYLGL